MVQIFTKVLEAGGSEEEAPMDLPYFKKGAWAQAMAYYQIDTDSRAAAEKLALTLSFSASARLRPRQGLEACTSARMSDL